MNDTEGMSERPEIIAERLFFVDGDKDKPAVILRLWRPYQPEGEYARGGFEVVTSDGSRKIEVPGGVDTLDCIVDALSLAGSIIQGLNESIFHGGLRWEASPEGGPGLGLPTIEKSWLHR
jgi:hypothetical protein